MSNLEIQETDTLESILTRAKKCSLKGRNYIYSRFKQELEELHLSPEEYQEACIELAKYLEV